ncbi:hypothetical protein N7540_000462 [Penicillium herquei]|nr:hypothetical protein N7540_000462 [Penicillium herquei]
MTDPTSIADLSSACKTIFSSIKRQLVLLDDGNNEEPLQGFSHDEFADASARFRMWAENLGAFQKNKSSLDYRVRQSDLRIEILRLLKELRSSLEIFTGEREQVTWYEGDDDSDEELSSSSTSDEQDDISPTPDKVPVLVTECSQRQVIIQDTIGSLLTLSILIYNSSRRNKFARSSREKEYDTRFDISHVAQCFPHASQNQALLEKLGKANAQRRQWLSYRKRHHSKITAGVSRQNSVDLQSVTETEIPAQMLDSGFLVSTLQIPSKVSTTEATTLRSQMHGYQAHDPDIRDTFSESNFSFSMSSHVSHPFKLLPRPPRESADGRPFECPLCFTIVTLSGGDSWMKHVYEDLSAYVCTFENCATPLFDSRHDWFHHEMEVHRRQWSCPFCGELFTKSHDLKVHTESSHRDSLKHIDQASVLAIASQPLGHIPASSCPLCDYEATLRSRIGDFDSTMTVTPAKFRSHLGHHLEQLALFVLPRPLLVEDVEENISSESEMQDDLRDHTSTHGDSTSEEILMVPMNEIIDVLAREVTSFNPDISKSPPPLALGWQPPHDFTPPVADLENDDPDLVPRREESMFGGDLYTPGWVRGNDNSKQGFCGRCSVGHWVNIHDGTYEYHLTYIHGIPPSGIPLPRPSIVQEITKGAGRWEGWCDSCQGWRLLRKPNGGWNWFQHCLTEHGSTTDRADPFYGGDIQNGIKYIRSRDFQKYSEFLKSDPRRLWLKDSHSRTLLHYAAESDQVEFSKITLAPLGSVSDIINAKSKAGLTPLMLAAGQGNLAAVEQLLIGGADVNIANDRGYRALDIAAHAGYPSISRIIIEHGANIHKAQLFQAVYSKKLHPSEHSEDSEPQSAPTSFIDDSQCSSVMRDVYTNNLNSVRRYIQKHGTVEIDTESVSSDGKTALMVAASRNYYQMVNLLLENGANIHATDNKNCTILMHAVKDNNRKMVDLLVSHGADVNHVSPDHSTALIEATQRGFHGIMRCLLKHEADPESRSSHDWTPLMHCCYQGDLDGAQLLLRFGAGVKECSQHDETPLLLAAAAGHTKIVKLLLESGASPNPDWVPDFTKRRMGERVPSSRLGWTPLMLGCQQGHVEIVSLLLRSGANLRPMSPMNRTALDIANENGRIEIVQMLTETNATP